MFRRFCENNSHTYTTRKYILAYGHENYCNLTQTLSYQLTERSNHLTKYPILWDF